MLPEQRKQLTALIQAALVCSLPPHKVPPLIVLERPKVSTHGDIACNVAMRLAKLTKRHPRELAQAIIDALVKIQLPAQALIQDVYIAGPGFINFRLTNTAHQAVIAVVAQQGANYGCAAPKGEKIIVEFISANPTGPLHVGHARQAVLGEALCRLYEATGWNVTREFYYNDTGSQIDKLSLSVQAHARGLTLQSSEYPSDGYRGNYIADIARDFLAAKSAQAVDGKLITATGNVDNLEDIRAFAVAYLRQEQDLDLKAFGLHFDHYCLESSLYRSGQIEEIIRELIARGYTYEKDGALWLRTTELGTGDDKDRVMRKSEGNYTYFVPDLAYHKTKWERGFRCAVNIQGSDHHGTIARIRAGLQALEIGIPKNYPSYILHKMVKVMQAGKEVKVSKRAGNYVTLRDLIDWVGCDAARYFLAQRRADTEFTFDVDLALSKNDENPVFYIQYAHARICSMLSNANVKNPSDVSKANIAYLTAPSELALMQRLAEYPNVVSLAAQELAPHHIAFWLRNCASDFHAWYNCERALVSAEVLKYARLRLALATKQVIANGLALLGVSAPERM